MREPLKIAVAGLGRMGCVHALHVLELSRESDSCVLAALVDPDLERAGQFASGHGIQVPLFGSIPELANANLANATVLSTPTSCHREHTLQLAAAGHRILLEKPLTGSLAGDLAFASELDANYPDSVMLAFQRRFDAPLAYAKDLIRQGLIGRVFRIFSALEDSGPLPDGYKSQGILPDMGVHNVDEVLWLTGSKPLRALAIGSRIHAHALSTAEEDFDEASLFVWFEDGAIAQVEVSRNHVSGYRVESLICGENGQIQVGHFDQNTREVSVEAFGRRGSAEPLARRVFKMPDYQKPLPEFVDRFGSAYKQEVAVFINCCRNGSPFPVTHRDGLAAQRVIEAGMNSIVTRDQAGAIT
jgi:predicted dehydrogenase